MITARQEAISSGAAEIGIVLLILGLAMGQVMLLILSLTLLIVPVWEHYRRNRPA